MSPTFSRPAITLAGANRILAAATAAAEARGLTVTMAIADPSGNLVAFARMDGSPVPVSDFALDKAYTAATLGKTTRAFGERMISRPQLTAGLSNRARVIAWPGGAPIVVDGATVGGIGISGATDEEDEALAEAGLAALAQSD